MDELLRHIRACNDAVLPGDRLPVRVSGQQVGWVRPALARAAAGLGMPRLAPDGLHVPPEALQPLARALAGAGAFRWRDEAFDVRAQPGAEPLGQIDRGALPSFGIQATGVHLNGLVGDHLWVAHRAQDKLLDPGKLDHLVAGGVAAGFSLEQTLVKEGEEEAGLPPALAAQARHVGVVTYAMERPEGLRRDVLHCYDLELPETFRPEPRDGEVSHFELWPLEAVLDALRHTDRFKFNVTLVLIDLLIRRGIIAGGAAATLRDALTGC